MTDLWHGVYGVYPIPDKFRALLLEQSTPTKRYPALRELGEFYHWVHSEECRECAKIVGMNRRRQQQKENRQ